MKPIQLILCGLALFLLLADVAAQDEDGRVIVLQGALDVPQAERVRGQILAADASGSPRVLLAMDLESAHPEAARRLAVFLLERGAERRPAAFVSGRAAQGALSVLLACDPVYVAESAMLGPAPTDEELKLALVEALGARGSAHAAYRPLIWPESGEDGILNAADAVAAGLATAVAEDRAAVLALLEMAPDRVEESITGSTAPPTPAGWQRRLLGPYTKPYLIPFDIPIDDTLVASIARRIDVAREGGADLIIFEMDSPGGLVSSSMDLGDMLYDLEIPTMMLILKGAYSGAALVSLAGDEIVMSNGGILGDCQPIMLSSDGYEVLGEKVQSPLRALFRKYADKNGYPVRLAESMITQEMQVDRVTFADGTMLYLTPEEVPGAEEEHGAAVKTTTVVKAGELLTFHGKECYETGLCGPTVTGRAGAFEPYDIDPAKVPRLEETWAEETSRFLLSIKALLFFAGIVALWMELKAPGFGVPGAIAITAFLLFFSASAISGIASELAVVLFILGVGLLALEFLVIPGFGVPGIAGFMLILLSLYMASVKYSFPTTGRVWEAHLLRNWVLEVGGAVIASLVAGAILVKFLPRTVVGRRLILGADSAVGPGGLSGSASVDSERSAGLVGRTGVALSALRPSGRIEVDGEPYPALTEGDWIDGGTQVVVLEVSGNRIVVKEA